jgi:hypothetical protein
MVQDDKSIIDYNSLSRRSEGAILDLDQHRRFFQDVLRFLERPPLRTSQSFHCYKDWSGILILIQHEARDEDRQTAIYLLLLTTY